MGLGAATSSVLRSGKFQDSATASGRRSVYPLPDCLVCWVPRLLSVEVALDPNEDFNHCQDSSLCFLPVCPSVSLSVFSLSGCLSACLLICVCSSIHICDHRLSVCPPLSVTSYLSDFCLMRALWLGWQHDGGPNTPSWEVRSMFPVTQHPLMGGEVLVAPRVGRAAVYAEAVRSPTVLCPSVLTLYCALSICLPACLSVCLSLGQGVPADGCGMRRRRRYSGDGGGGE